MDVVLNSGGINWTWYLWATIDPVNGTIYIKKYDRLHDTRDFNHPKTVGGCHLFEDGDRVVTDVDVYMGGNVNKYRVSNPRHVFSYD